jgi:hypothetical protein
MSPKPQPGPLLADPREIARSIGTLHRPGDVVELRVPKTDHAGTISGYFDDHAKLAAALAERNGSGPGVYTTLNPVKRALLARAANRVKIKARVATADDDIERRRWLLIDCDPRRPSEISSSDSEHEAALQLALLIRTILWEAGWPEPVLADSGNGAHLLYPIDLPNDADAKNLIENVLKALASEFDDAAVTIDRTVFNAARIVKAYGTVAAKGDSIAERPHRLSRLLEVPAELKPVSRELLEALAAKAVPPKARSTPPRGNESFSVEEFIARNLPQARDPVSDGHGGRKWVLNACPFNPEHQDSAVFEAASGQLGFHCFHNSCSGRGWKELRELFEGPRQHSRAESPPPRDEEPPQDGKQSRRDDAALKLTSLRDLLAEPEENVDWVLDGILPAGGVGLFAGKPKSGKSTWVRCLCVSTARGEAFLGRRTTKGSVLYLALEEKRSEVRKHFDDLGATGEELIHIHIDPAPAQALLAAQRAIAVHKPVLVIIDPLLKFARVKDTNDYAQVNAALEPLLILARQSGAHVLLVYHAGKGDKSDPVDSALGSTAFAGAVDTLLTYKRTERYRTLQTVQRYGQDLPETVIQWDAERRAVSLGAERSQAEIERVKTEILDHLKPGSRLTEDQICEAIEGKHAIKRMALRELLKSGQVTREGGGKRGDPYHYSLAPNAPPPGQAEAEVEL